MQGLLCIAVTLYACAAPSPTAAPTVEPTATATPAGIVVPLFVAPGTGLGVGPKGGCGGVGFSDLRVHGDPNRTPSVWVEAVDGGQRVVIRWPPGFSARFEPELVLYDAHGQAVAHEGDILTNASGNPEFNGHPTTLYSFNGVDYPCE